MLILYIVVGPFLRYEVVHLLYRGLLALVHGVDTAVSGGLEIRVPRTVLYACSDIIRIGKKSMASGFVRVNNWTRMRKWQNRLYFVKYICYNVLNMHRFVELLYRHDSG